MASFAADQPDPSPEMKTLSRGQGHRRLGNLTTTRQSARHMLHTALQAGGPTGGPTGGPGITSSHQDTQRDVFHVGTHGQEGHTAMAEQPALQEAAMTSSSGPEAADPSMQEALQILLSDISGFAAQVLESKYQVLLYA
jgi:hypothetical protein